MSGQRVLATSRAIATLEKDVGAALLTRSMRAVVLTEAGTNYLARIEPLLAALSPAGRAAKQAARAFVDYLVSVMGGR